VDKRKLSRSVKSKNLREEVILEKIAPWQTYRKKMKKDSEMEFSHLRNGKWLIFEMEKQKVYF